MHEWICGVAPWPTRVTSPGSYEVPDNITHVTTDISMLLFNKGALQCPNSGRWNGQSHGAMPFALTIGKQGYAHDICTEVFTKGSLRQTLLRISYPPSSTPQPAQLPRLSQQNEARKCIGAHALDRPTPVHHTIKRLTTDDRALEVSRVFFDLVRRAPAARCKGNLWSLIRPLAAEWVWRSGIR